MEQKVERKRNVANNITDMFERQWSGKWFIAFGTLLKFSRQTFKSNRQFNIDDDIDIGIIGGFDRLVNTVKNLHPITHYIKNDHTGEYLNFSYREAVNNVTIDVFNFKKFQGMYFHTYDVKMEFPKNGIPSEYIWKGLPADIFEVNPKKIEKYQKALAYGRVMTDHGTWRHHLWECPAEGATLCLPYGYGDFLTKAYPDWLTEREQFGVSECKKIITVKSCKGLY